MTTTADYGPQTAEVAALIDRAGRLTPDEATALATARVAWDAAWDAAWVAAWDAAWGADRGAARATARGAAWDAARATARGAAWAALAASAAAAVVAALVVRDLIGQHGFTQEHYDTVTRPWATVIGPVHPDDKPIGEHP